MCCVLAPPPSPPQKATEWGRQQRRRQCRLWVICCVCLCARLRPTGLLNFLINQRTFFFVLCLAWLVLLLLLLVDALKKPELMQKWWVEICQAYLLPSLNGPAAHWQRTRDGSLCLLLASQPILCIIFGLPLLSLIVHHFYLRPFSGTFVYIFSRIYHNALNILFPFSLFHPKQCVFASHLNRISRKSN